MSVGGQHLSGVAERVQVGSRGAKMPYYYTDTVCSMTERFNDGRRVAAVVEIQFGTEQRYVTLTTKEALDVAMALLLHCAAAEAGKPALGYRPDAGTMLWWWMKARVEEAERAEQQARLGG